MLSKEALKRFGEKRKGVCREDQGAEDVEIGDCMQRLGVRVGDSRDSLGRSRFHCFNPETHVHGGYPDWYLKYDKYGAAKVIRQSHAVCPDHDLVCRRLEARGSPLGYISSQSTRRRYILLV